MAHAIDSAHAAPQRRSQFYKLMLGCIGVVYGDIGTSPLYAFREAAHHINSDGNLRVDEVYGVLSLIIWALIIIVTIKYVLFLLKLDNKGEGGLISLMAMSQKSVGRKLGTFVFIMGLVGTALFYGDAAITPAISVLSAVEGLKLITPAFANLVMPISLLILIGLFAAQRYGTGKVSALFGPITLVWFLVLGGVGVYWIIQKPDILSAFNPYYSLLFLIDHGLISFIVLGSVFLAVTGAEALYADMGHFGRKPIQYAWLWIVFPCLVLNYMGQGALVLSTPSAIDNPFYRMTPEWGLWPMVILATMATIIASQAMITGAYSVTRQAIQLGLLPRMEIRHTSADHEGQIYMPKINNILLIGVILLCLVFKGSSALASAYGISVIGSIITSTILAFIVLWKVKKKNVVLVALFIAPFLAVEFVFLLANMFKVFDGGYYPLLFAGFLVLSMSIWVKGSKYLYQKAQRNSIPLTDLVESLEREPLATAKGTAVFLTSDPAFAPIALLQNIKHNRVLHERNIVVSVITSNFAKVPDAQRILIQHISSNFTRVFVNYGYMEFPNIPRELVLAKSQGLEVNLEDVSYFLGRRAIVSDPSRGLPLWQDNIYISMLKSASAATDFYRLPPDRVVELGIRMTI
jgi:KUP system potassium uptake protein